MSRGLLAAETVLDVLGPHHSEAVYQKAMLIELKDVLEVTRCESEVVVPICYKDRYVGTIRLDIVVNNSLIVELKSSPSKTLRSADMNQLEKYIRNTSYESGVLICFSGDKLQYWCPIFNENGAPNGETAVEENRTGGVPAQN